MLITRELDKLCKSCIAHFDELPKNESNKIYVFSITLESFTIWGGNGDRDKDLHLYITQNGWEKHIITTEYGSYQKGDGVLESQITPTSSSEIEKYINGECATIDNVKTLLRFYDKIRDMYRSEF